MEQAQAQRETTARTSDGTTRDVKAESATTAAVTPQAAAESCPTCSAAQASGSIGPPRCVYVIGHIEPRYPTLGMEKEARQAAARAGTAGETDREIMAKALQDPNNKYLVRRLCWVLLIQGIEHYILVPRDGDFQPLVDAYRAEPKPGDLELAIGVLGPIAPPAMCNGLLVPILIFDRIYAFDRKSLLDSIPKPKNADPKQFTAAAGEMLDRILEQRDNAGATPEDIAVNYIAMQYTGTYKLGAEQLMKNASLTSINVLPSPLSGPRTVVDVVFAFNDRDNDVVSKYFVRVDVTECFPFLVSKMAPYYDR
jgi:PatG C-terminal